MPTMQRLGTAELLFRCARRMGLQPYWVTPGGLFVISIMEEDRYINFTHSPLNSHASASLAKNKYLTRLILERNDLQNIPFCHPKTLEEAEAFIQIHKKIIVKPIDGAGARDIHIVTHASQLPNNHIEKYIFEKYIAGRELRYLVLNGAVIGVYRSDYGTSVDVMRPLQCISYPKAIWDKSLVSSSLNIAHILDLKFATIDYLVTPSGREYILEVNTTPDLKWFHAPTIGPPVNVAQLFLEALIDDVSLAARPTLAYS